MEAETNVPHSMRVAAHGKISALVAFALNFLKNNETRAIELHTLPYRKPGGQAATEPVTKAQKILSPTNDIPRLISVVEIIKREFKEGLLYQYNELGCLDEPAPADERTAVPGEAGQERQDAILRALGGKNHLPIQRTPYMKITLCRTALPENLTAGKTYQPPVVKRISRGAKARKRRRAKQDAVSGDEGDAGEEDTMEVIPT